MTGQIFISHSSRDPLAVETVRLQLLAAGVTPYMYEYDHRPGAVLVDKLRAAIAASDAVVVLLTAAGAGSETVHQEIGISLGLRKPVIPLVEAGVGAKELALLNGLEYVLFDPQSPQAALAAMTNQVQRLLTGRGQTQRLAAQPVPVPAWVGGGQAVAVPTPSPDAYRELVVALALVGALLIIAILSSQS
ncbi:MAG: toll/interleukin-1 receptor domain-containing protein [Candidatus Dormibacteria bacterium]